MQENVLESLNFKQNYLKSVNIKMVRAEPDYVQLKHIKEKVLPAK